MRHRESDIAHESGDYWVLRLPRGYEVYKTGVTCSVRVAIVGYEGERGLEKAKVEIMRRQNEVVS